MHVAVAVLRLQEGLDFTGIVADFDAEESQNRKKKAGIDNPQYSNTLDGTAASASCSMSLTYNYK